MIAYCGKPITLQRLVTEPAHGLMHQARYPQELRYTRTNADGYGFTWLDQNGEFVSRRSIQPLWQDPALATLGRHRSGLWLGMARSATEGMSVRLENTQPFVAPALNAGATVFMHNGFVRRFATSLLPYLLTTLSPAQRATLQGDTDSEYLFALLLHLHQRHGARDWVSALRQLMRTLADELEDERALLGILLYNGETIYALRHGINEPCPSLYMTTKHPEFPDSVVIASECFDHHASWQPLPEDVIVTIQDPARINYHKL